MQSIACSPSLDRVIVTSVPLAPPSRSECLTPKLRSSCDGCGVAKVRCDRGQPGCSRCTMLGSTCVYGPSRRFGKPPRKRPGVDRAEATINKRTCTSWTAQDRDSHLSMVARELQTTNDSTQENSSHSDANVLPLFCGIDVVLYRGNEEYPLTSGFYSTVPFEQWFQLVLICPWLP